MPSSESRSERWLLCQESLIDGERQYYFSNLPPDTPLNQIRDRSPRSSRTALQLWDPITAAWLNSWLLAVQTLLTVAADPVITGCTIVRSTGRESPGAVVDPGTGELALGDEGLAGAYIASGGWVMQYSQERFTDDFSDLR